MTKVWKNPIKWVVSGDSKKAIEELTGIAQNWHYRVKNQMNLLGKNVWDTKWLSYPMGRVRVTSNYRNDTIFIEAVSVGGGEGEIILENNLFPALYVWDQASYKWGDRYMPDYPTEYSGEGYIILSWKDMTPIKYIPEEDIDEMPEANMVSHTVSSSKSIISSSTSWPRPPISEWPRIAVQPPCDCDYLYWPHDYQSTTWNHKIMVDGTTWYDTNDSFSSDDRTSGGLSGRIHAFQTDPPHFMALYERNRIQTAEGVGIYSYLAYPTFTTIITPKFMFEKKSVPSLVEAKSGLKMFGYWTNEPYYEEKLIENYYDV